MKTPKQYIEENQDLCAKAAGYKSYADLETKATEKASKFQKVHVDWVSCIAATMIESLKAMQEDHEKELIEFAKWAAMLKDAKHAAAYVEQFRKENPIQK